MVRQIWGESSSPEEQFETWIASAQSLGAVRDGIIWPTLDDAERQRRLAIVQEHYPLAMPLIACAQRGTASTEVLPRPLWEHMLVHEARRQCSESALVVIHYRAELVWGSGDGLLASDMIEEAERLEAACRLTMELRARTARATDVLLAPSTRTLGVHILDSWGTPPDELASKVARGDATARATALANPMTPSDTLATAHEAFPYPTDDWEVISEAGGYVPDAWDPDYFDDETWPRTNDWAAIAANPSMPADVLLGLWQERPHFHEREVVVLGRALAHPNLPRDALAEALDYACERGIEWRDLPLGMNPGASEEMLVRFIEGALDARVRTSNDAAAPTNFTSLDLLLGPASHAKTPEVDRAHLALLGSDRLCQVLAATSEPSAG